MRQPTFDEIPDRLRAVVNELRAGLEELGTLHAVRDLWGRVRFVLPVRPEAGSALAITLEELAKAVTEKLGPHGHPAPQAILYADELGADLAGLIGGPALELDLGPPALRLVDRQVTGLSWSTVVETPPASGREPSRLAFYSIKGGVGRSTAAAIGAWHLARQGQSVLVLDLDLEAPGLSASLLPPDNQPDYGIVDWFVEDAVGQGESIIGRMVAPSPLATELPGNIWVVPSHGASPGEYLAKLGRCYLDLPGSGTTEAWEQRLVRLLLGLEEARRPDVVLLDTRAGLADLASVAVTELGADVLLFAVGTEQTWSAYRLLFEHWRRTDAITKLRERLQIVAALVPETERQAYLSAFRQDSWNLFLEHVYDALGEAETEGFSFDLTDQSAPHHPVPIFWNRGLATLSNFEGLDSRLVEAACGHFLSRLEQMLPAPGEAPE